MAETRRIDQIKIGSRYRRDLGDIDALAQSIDEVGLLHPIVVSEDNTLIAGERRLAALRLLGKTEVPVHVVPLRQIVRGEFAENVIRKDFTPSEMVAIAEALEPVELEKARERIQEGAKIGAQITNTGERPVETFHGAGKTRDKVAAYVGVSGRTLEKAKEVVEAAETEPGRFSSLVEEMDRTGRVDGVYRKLQVAMQVDQINREPPPLPTGPFRVIVADPPWPYEKRAEDPSHRAALPYPSMTVDAIKALPVGEMAADDAILWLWATNAHLRVAFDVLEAWGFTYKTLLTWVKDRFGTGDWLRGQTEHCLLAVRGKPVVNLTNQTTVIHGPVREHSRKPESFYAMVDTLCPGAKVELFARKPRDGWQCHGNDTDRFW